MVLPNPACQHILELLHETHQGMVVMKSMTISLVWWQNIDAEVERCSRQCSQCLQNSPMPPKAEPVPWPEPKECWERLHLDYAGPFEGKMLLVLVDAKSKWLEVVIVASATSEQTLEHLRNVFAKFGLPKCVVTDNETPFSGQLPRLQSRKRDQAPPNCPVSSSTNGLAEQAVCKLRMASTKQREENSSSDSLNGCSCIAKHPVRAEYLQQNRCWLIQ